MHHEHDGVFPHSGTFVVLTEGNVAAAAPGLLLAKLSGHATVI